MKHGTPGLKASSKVTGAMLFKMPFLSVDNGGGRHFLWFEHCREACL